MSNVRMVIVDEWRDADGTRVITDIDIDSVVLDVGPVVAEIASYFHLTHEAIDQIDPFKNRRHEEQR